ncbi:MAG TPA: MFS transporter [Solirubrobacteraceae bacterium]|nr:MFS transporter [Solirubrobacteraceae bacterium]
MPALVVGSLLGRLPYGMTSLSLVFFLVAQTGSFAAAGAVAASAALAAALGGPVLGRIIDRRGQTAVLLAAVAVHTVGLLAIVAVGRADAPVAVLAVLAAVSGAATPPLSPCLRALWPVLLDDRSAVRTALVIDAVVIEAVFIGGPLTVAVIVAIDSPSTGLLVAAVLALAGTLLFAIQPPSREWRGSARRGRGPSPLMAAGIRTLLIGACGLGIMFGALEVALPAFAAERGRPGIAGVALAVIAAGSVVGGLTYGARTGGVATSAGDSTAGGTRDLRPLYLALVAALPLAVGLLLLADSVLALLLLAPVAGLAIAPLTAAENELAGTVAPPGTVTEAYAWLVTALIGGVAAGNALAGALVEEWGWRIALAAACGCALLGALVTLARRRTLTPR